MIECVSISLRLTFFNPLKPGVDAFFHIAHVRTPGKSGLDLTGGFAPVQGTVEGGQRGFVVVGLGLFHGRFVFRFFILRQAFI